jgi:hypothetical protein
MALLQGLLAAVFRSLGKILNTAFGWATILLFGKVPAKKQTYLSAASLGSLVWLIAALGVASPRVAAFLLAFITLPEWFGDNWLRLVMLGAVVIIPPIVGVLALLMVDAEDRPQGVGGKIKGVLRGYPYTLGLSLTFLIMMIFAPIMKLQALWRRWKALHVPIVVESEHYLDVLADLERAIDDSGIETRREPATWLVRFPTKLLTLFAGSTLARFVASELTTLRGDEMELVLHPSDMILRGKEKVIARVRAIITEKVTFMKAHFTYEKEAQEIEDRLLEVFEASRDRGELGQLDRKGLEALHQIEKDMRRIELPYEEWEVLYREKLQVERVLLGTGLGLRDYHEESAIEKLARDAA